MWKRGFNFLQKRYKIIGKNEFLPHIRKDGKATIPCQILQNFNVCKKGIILIKIKCEKGKYFRIKKLNVETNSRTISLKAERFFKKLKIEVLDIKTEKEALSRDSKDIFSIKNFIPKFTSSGKGSSPIYLFENGLNLIVGGYYKKDLIVKNKIEFDETTLESLGLYFAEGGKIAASFTNSWPNAINSVLSFVERLFNIKRKRIKASICCAYSLNKKQKQLEKFWKVKTRISNFSKSLHFNKNSVSSQGILELYFCSEVIKSVLIDLINKISNYDIDAVPLLRGIFSGDASPILQNKYCITHNLAFNDKEKNIYLYYLKKAFPDTKINIIQKRFVLYSSWEENKKLLFEDIYKFNSLNRAKFARQFFSLPKTKKILPYDSELQEFLKSRYPKIISELLNIYKKLINFKIQNKNFIENEARKWIT